MIALQALVFACGAVAADVEHSRDPETGLETGAVSHDEAEEEDRQCRSWPDHGLSIGAGTEPAVSPDRVRCRSYGRLRRNACARAPSVRSWSQERRPLGLRHVGRPQLA